VIPYTTATVVTPLAVRSRTSRNTWPTPGHPLRYSFSQVVVVIVRRSTRP
jgi:hypothetical protein